MKVRRAGRLNEANRGGKYRASSYSRTNFQLMPHQYPKDLDHQLHYWYLYAADRIFKDARETRSGAKMGLFDELDCCNI